MATAALVLAVLGLFISICIVLVLTHQHHENLRDINAVGSRLGEHVRAYEQEKGKYIDADNVVIELVNKEVRNLTNRPHRELDPEERQQLQTVWSTAMCQHCGYVHMGTCTRIKNVTNERKGAVVTETVEYWPNDQWAPPEGALSVEDVFGAAVPPSPTEETNAGA